MRIKLTRKMAWVLNGIDLTKRNIGEVFDLPSDEARMLIAERWAEPVDERPDANNLGITHRGQP